MKDILSIDCYPLNISGYYLKVLDLNNWRPDASIVLWRFLCLFKTFWFCFFVRFFDFSSISGFLLYHIVLPYRFHFWQNFCSDLACYICRTLSKASSSDWEKLLTAIPNRFQTHTHTYMYIHTLTPTRTYTHTHTHPHTHTFSSTGEINRQV